MQSEKFLYGLRRWHDKLVTGEEGDFLSRAWTATVFFGSGLKVQSTSAEIDGVGQASMMTLPGASLYRPFATASLIINQPTQMQTKALAI
jgi:hypothetical protein